MEHYVMIGKVIKRERTIEGAHFVRKTSYQTKEIYAQVNPVIDYILMHMLSVSFPLTPVAWLPYLLPKFGM